MKFIGFLYEIFALHRRTNKRVDSFRLILFSIVGLDIKCVPDEPFEMVLKIKTHAIIKPIYEVFEANHIFHWPLYGPTLIQRFTHTVES